jgi:uncharacterized protein YndB with AHSA1/START domain
MNAEPQRQKKQFQLEIELDAPLEAVWKAVSDGEELTRWYPLEARVTPGVGGSMTFSFGPGMEGTVSLHVWEPNRHLRAASWPAGSETPAAELPGSPFPSVLDFYLESRGGKTVLRLVHAGFLSGAAWEEEYLDSLEKGWPFMLANLRHYLRFHRGTPRIVGWANRGVAVAPEEAWRRLMSAEGLLREGSLDALRPGGRYHLRAATGDLMEGVVEAVAPPKFWATVENLNNAFFAVLIEKCGGPTQAGVWLSSFGVPRAEVEAFRERWSLLLEKLFPELAPGA